MRVSFYTLNKSLYYREIKHPFKRLMAYQKLRKITFE